MIRLLEYDQKIQIWNCLIFQYTAYLIAAKTNENIIRVIFLSLVSLVEDTAYLKSIENIMTPSFYKRKLNILKEMQTIRKNLKKNKIYNNTPSINGILKEIERKCKIHKMTPKNPNIWGATVWSLLHWISLMYTKKNSLEVKNVVYLIIEHLPCSICKNHATDYMKKINFPYIREKEKCINIFSTFIIL